MLCEHICWSLSYSFELMKKLFHTGVCLGVRGLNPTYGGFGLGLRRMVKFHQRRRNASGFVLRWGSAWGIPGRYNSAFDPLLLSIVLNDDDGSHTYQKMSEKLILTIIYYQALQATCCACHFQPDQNCSFLLTNICKDKPRVWLPYLNITKNKYQALLEIIACLFSAGS